MALSLSKVMMIWGDGSITTDTTAPFGPFSHTYLTSGIKRLTHRAYDARGQIGTETATVSANLFSITGTVKQSNDSSVVPGVKVQAKKVGSTIVKTVYTGISGAFSVTSLTPGTYKMYVSKYRFDFGSGVSLPHLADTITVGPSDSDNTYNSVTP